MTKTGSGKPANEGNRSASGAREIVLDVLLEILEKKQYSHLVLQRALAKYQYLDKQERSLTKRTVDGTLEGLMQVDCLIESYSSVKLRKMKPVIRTILRMSVYQICFMDRIPDSAACNEAVKLAVRRGFSGLKGFVNGVLRKGLCPQPGKGCRSEALPPNQQTEGIYRNPESIRCRYSDAFHGRWKRPGACQVRYRVNTSGL